MRWRPSRARRLPPPPPPDEMLVTEDRLRRNVEDVLAVRDRQVRGAIVVFRGELTTEPARALDLLIDRFRPLGYMPCLRAEEAGVVAVQACPFTEPVAPQRIRTNVLLFVATCVSTLVAGFGLPFIGLGFVGSPTFDALRASSSLLRFLAGLAVAIPAIVLGLAWSTVVPEPPGGHFAFGDSMLTRALTYLRFGSIPPGHMVFTHPVADAAWAGLFVTALNLFPIGQLDGGRIAYALFGARHRAIGKATVAALVALGAISFARGLHLSGGDVVFAVFFSLNWFLVAALVSLLVGLHHSPPLDDVSPISAGRRVVGVVCLALLVLMIPPFIH